MYVYLYRHNTYTNYTYIFCKQKYILDAIIAINRLTALQRTHMMFKGLCYFIYLWIHFFQNSFNEYKII